MSTEKKELYDMASEIAKKGAQKTRATAARVNEVIAKLTDSKALTNDQIRRLSREYFVDSVLIFNEVHYDIELWRRILMNPRFEGKLYSSCIALYYPYHLL